jgi:hypothetical protein
MIRLNERQVSIDWKAPSEVRFENTFISAVHAVPERDATAVTILDPISFPNLPIRVR